MKKKMMIFLCLAVMAGSIAACGSETGNRSDKEKPGTEVSRGETDNSEKEAENSSAKITPPEGLGMPFTDYDYGFKMYVTGFAKDAGYGAAYYEIDRYDTELIYITKYSGEVDEEQKERIDMSQYEDSTDIFDLLIDNIYYDYYKSYPTEIVNYEVDIIETKEINGYEMTKFEGKLDTVSYPGKKWEYKKTYPIVAYGIKANTVPILVCCIDQTEDSSRHEYWVDKIDDIVSTFREEE